jgi:AsmA protein
MRKPVKIALSIITALVFLVIIAIFTLPFFIDPNDFKPEIAAAVKNKTGRDLTISGELKLSIFPWLGISLGKITLGNATGFQDQPFATLEESDIKVKLLPLVTKKIEVKHIVLKGLTLNLAKNQQGGNNWDDLIAPPDATNTTAPPSAHNAGKNGEIGALAVLAIGGIAIENARINWDDQESGEHLLIKDINLIAGKFSYDEPSQLIFL